VEDTLKLIRETAEKFDDADIYYALRKMQIKHITELQMKAIKVFLALRNLGMLKVTTTLFSEIMNLPSGNAIALLHRLGDKRVINLLRGETKHTSYRYMLSSTFLQHFKRNI